jgi:hypothetical protein
VDADEPLALAPLVKGGDVREADQGLGCHGLASRAHHGLRAPIRQLRQKPHGAVPAAGAENRSFRAVGEEFVQLRETSLIVAGQVAVSLKDSGVVLNAVAFGDDGDACFK